MEAADSLIVANIWFNIKIGGRKLFHLSDLPPISNKLHNSVLLFEALVRG